MGSRTIFVGVDVGSTSVRVTLEGGQDALARLYLVTIQALAYGTRHIRHGGYLQ